MTLPPRGNNDHFETIFEMVKCVHENKTLIPIKPKPKDIFDAVILGDSDGVRNYLLNSKKINLSRNNRGRSILHEAVLRGHIHIVTLLLDEFDFRIDSKTMLGEETPLHLAAFTGNTKIVHELLKRGAEVNSRNNDGNTPYDYSQKEDIHKLLTWYEAHI